jgi:esterase
LLHHQRLSAPAAEPRRWLLMLHGILGRGENLRGLASRWCALRPEWGVVLADLRLHGESQGFPPPHTLAAATADVAELIAALPAVHAVAGHSFGGKVALGLLDTPGVALEHLLVLDAAPGARLERSGDDVTARVLTALGTLPARLSDRAQFGATLGAQGVSQPLIQWLAKNLVREPDGLRFGLDLPALEALLADHDRVDFWPRVETPPASTALHFVVAGRSHVVDASDRARLAALQARGVLTLDELPDAGHWLHVDDLQGVLGAFERRLG